jgi:tetratricopeptide (TPR) repeat protein
MGFEMMPLTDDNMLDTSLDFSGGPHKLDKDPLYKSCCDNREQGNNLVKESKYEEAIGRYSELIIKSRTLENETDIIWTDDTREQVRLLRATTYLNLSLCFTKLQQWQHASNTATRALQGDKDPPNPKENVLPADKKAKALFRRATAQCEGFGNFDKAHADLKQAREFAPDDKAIEMMFRKCDIAVKKTSKTADRKMAGFLKKEAASDKGLFDDSLRKDYDTEGPKLPSEPVKVRDGLYLVPKQEDADAFKKTINPEDGEGINFEELSREIAELKDERPEIYQEIREKVKLQLESETRDAEKWQAESDAAAAAEGA